jgi:O-antigen/teichoic acid export membrane protein
MKHKHIKNMASNYVGAFFSSAFPILSLPFFLRTLGVEHWGIVAILSMTVSFLGIVDAGFSQVLIREFSSKSDSLDDNLGVLNRRFVSFKTIYLFAAIIILITIFIISEYVVKLWFNLDGNLSKEAQFAFIGAGFVSAFQIGSAPQRALLLASGDHFILNLISILSSAVKYCGAVVGVIFFPTVHTVIFIFIFGSLLEFSFRMWAVEKKNNFTCKFGIYWRDVIPLLPQMLIMFLAVSISLLSLQIDKLITSYMLTIKDFAIYSIASSISMGALQFIYPVTTTFTPEIFSDSNNPKTLRNLNIKIVTILLFGAILSWFIFIKYGQLLLLSWLSERSLVDAVLTPISFLLIGVTINAFYNVCYLNWLAFGKVNLILKMNFLSLVISIIITPILVKSNGINGAAAGWALLNFLMLLSGLFVNCRKVN